MDKFGVLKLLSSLFDLYKKNSTPNSSKSSGDFDVDKLLSPLKNIINSNGQKNDSSKIQQPIKTPTATVPLQSKMLYTMQSHDQIVERVKNNVNKQKTQR